MQKLNICLLFGGPSGEHEVSLQSAKSVYQALDKEKYNIYPVGIDKNDQWFFSEDGNFLIESSDDYRDTKLNINSMKLVEIMSDNNLVDKNNKEIITQIDLVLPVIHGTFGEDGELQGVLDKLSIPYVFSGAQASELAMNKEKSKSLAKDNGLDTASSIFININNDFDIKDIVQRLSLPIVIKPNALGSSVGMSIAKNEQELEQGIKEAFKYSKEILLEKFIKGRELTVPVIGNNNPDALPVIEIIPKVSGWFDYKAKYSAGGSDEICPAEIPEDIKNKIQEMSVNIFKAVGCSDLARADFIWSKDDNKLYFLEINTIPGMTSASLVPKSAKASGLEFDKFLDKLIEIAQERYKEKKKLTSSFESKILDQANSIKLKQSDNS